MSSLAKSKKSSAAKSSTEPYSLIKLYNSNSLAQFVKRSKDKASVQNCTAISNVLNPSFCKVATPSKQKRIRGSKSCIKGCKLNASDLAANTFSACIRPNSIHIPNAYRDSSGKKPKAKTDALSTLNKISEALQRIKKPELPPSAYSTVPSQKKFASNRKLLNNTSVKRKRSNEGGRGDVENSDLDSAAIITDATVTAKRIEESSKYMEYKKAIIHNLTNNLKAVEREKNKSDPKQTLDRKFAVISEAFKEVIALDSQFRSVLKSIQGRYQELHSEYDKHNKSLRDSLSSEICKAQMEMAKQKVKYETVKSEQNKLLKEVKEKLEVIKRQEKIIAELKSEDNKAQQVNDRNLIESLHKENKKLLVLVRRGDKELRNSKKREKALIKLLKEDAAESQDISLSKAQASEKALNKTVVEVGKNKVKVPVLNIAKTASKKPLKLKVVKYYKENNVADELDEDSSEGKGKCNAVEDVVEESEGCELPLDNFLEKIGAVSNTSGASIKTS